MTELLGELVDKWVILFAVLSVAVTEAIMRKTSERVTRWKYAIPCTAALALVMSVAWSFRQADVTWTDGIVRGIISAVIAIVGYDTLKSVVINLPFINTSKQ